MHLIETLFIVLYTKRKRNEKNEQKKRRRRESEFVCFTLKWGKFDLTKNTHSTREEWVSESVINVLLHVFKCVSPGTLLVVLWLTSSGTGDFSLSLPLLPTRMKHDRKQRLILHQRHAATIICSLTYITSANSIEIIRCFSFFCRSGICTSAHIRSIIWNEELPIRKLLHHGLFVLYYIGFLFVHTYANNKHYRHTKNN